MSGVGSVEHQGKYFQLTLMSNFRAMFTTREAERAWGDRWKSDNTPLLEMLRVAVAAKMDSILDRFGLVPYDPRIPEIRLSPDPDPNVLPGPCRHRMEFPRLARAPACATLWISMAKVLKREDLESLRRELAPVFESRLPSPEGPPGKFG